MNREQVAHELRTPLTTIKGVLNLLGSSRFEQLPRDIAHELVGRAQKQLRVLEVVVERIEAEFEQPGMDEDRVIVLYEEMADAHMP